MSEYVYRAPLTDAQDEFTEKRSRFIGHVFLCETEQEALEKLEAIRKEYWDARHNVYAYSIRNGATRFSDDGEPGGTGGKPVLEVFVREGIENFLCVVTRYFGGILLGAGGLTRAYAKGAKIALDAAGIAEYRRALLYSLSLDYSLYERIKLEIERAEGIISDTAYADRITLEYRLPEENASAFAARLTELSAGRLEQIPKGEMLVAFPAVE